MLDPTSARWSSRLGPSTWRTDARRRSLPCLPPRRPRGGARAARARRATRPAGGAIAALLGSRADASTKAAGLSRGRPGTRYRARARGAASGACSSARASAAAVVTIAPAATHAPVAVLPSPAPATRSSPGRPSTAPSRGETITETESCAGCHARGCRRVAVEPARLRRASTTPSTASSSTRFRKRRRATTRAASAAGCHDVALLVDGAMSGDVAPGDPRAHGGIACRVCHGIESVRPDGNGSYTLA